MASAPPPRMSSPLEGPAQPPKRSTPIGLIIAVAIVCSCGALIVIFAAILFPVFAQARRAAQSARCISNLRQLGASVNLYASDFDGHFPDPKNWMDEVSRIKSRPRFRCPAVAGSQYGFAFNKDLAGKKVSQVEPSHELIFDSNLLERNANSGLESLPSPGRHGFGGRAVNHILHVDGSVESRTN